MYAGGRPSAGARRPTAPAAAAAKMAVLSGEPTNRPEAPSVSPEPVSSESVSSE